MTAVEESLSDPKGKLFFWEGGIGSRQDFRNSV